MKIEHCIYLFFIFNYFFKIFSIVIFHLAVGFQRHQIYFFKILKKVIMTRKISAINKKLYIFSFFIFQCHDSFSPDDRNFVKTLSSQKMLIALALDTKPSRKKKPKKTVLFTLSFFRMSHSADKSCFFFLSYRNQALPFMNFMF